MPEIDELIRNALRDIDLDAPPDESIGSRLTGLFLSHTRWVNAFAWMKMAGTMMISILAGTAFFFAESARAQLALSTLTIIGFVAFAMWWIWYWLILNRNDALREIKRLELQVAELREAAR